MTDLSVQKITSLQRCVARAREAYAAAGPGVRIYPKHNNAMLRRHE